MNFRSSFRFVLFFTCFVLLQAQQEKQSKLEKLKELQRKSQVIDFTDDRIQSFTTQKSDYTIVLLMATTNNQIPGADLAVLATTEFSRVASSYLSSLGSDGMNSEIFRENPIFFARCELERCKEAFKEGGTKAGWKAIPKILIIPPRSEKGALDVNRWIDMSADPIVGLASDIATWIRGVTGYDNLVIVTPFLERFGNTIVTLLLGGAAFYVAYPRLKIYTRSHYFWFILSIATYSFSMAGVVFNSIHNPPWYYVHPQTKQTMYIYPSARQQFVAEGLIMASLLSGLGLVCVGFGFWVPSLKENGKKRLAFGALCFLFFMLYQQLMRIFRAKYSWYPY